MKNKLRQLFHVRKPIIGMLHLDYLLGSPKYKGVDFVVYKAKKDIESLQRGGIDGILIENWKEDSVGEYVSRETADAMMAVVMELKKYIKVPFGINVLNNDYKVAFSIAAASGASFVQLDVLVDEVVSDFSYSDSGKSSPFEIKVDLGDVKKFAKSVGMGSLPLFCFVQPKHYVMLDKTKKISQSVKEAENFGVVGVLVTRATGIAPTLELINEVKSASTHVAVGIGSGFSMDNASDIYPLVDFVIVGSSLKYDGDVEKQVDVHRVKKLMEKIIKIRRQIRDN